MTKCVGCGIKLQSSNKDTLGYTPKVNNKLCERCFKLKHYNTSLNEGITIDNNELIDRINKTDAFVFYLVDIINLDKENIDLFKRINNEKILVITKSDIIPKNVYYDTLINNIKDIYEIEDIIICSSKKKFSLRKLKSVCLLKKKVLFAGFTNAGKSSLINSLVGSDITVSSHSNTTQDFIKLNVDGVTIYDIPGFMSNTNRENILTKDIKPITYNLPSKHYLNINGIKLNLSSDSNFTIYGDNLDILRRKELDDVKCDIAIDANMDLVIKGVCFIRFKNNTLVKLSTKDYEIRKSIIGLNKVE